MRTTALQYAFMFAVPLACKEDLVEWLLSQQAGLATTLRRQFHALCVASSLGKSSSVAGCCGS